MNKFTIIPSNLEYKSAPSVNQEVVISLEEKNQEITEYQRTTTIDLAQVFNDERQSCTTFRPTFKVNYIYENIHTGTTSYLPFKNTLFYVSPLDSLSSGIWNGYPQYYEFDFFRPNISDQHIEYLSKSAYTYNWTYYVSYAYNNNYDKQLTSTLNNTNINWVASDGIPFSINLSSENGNGIISFQCIAPHGLSIGEYVELSISYGITNLFQVDSLGNGKFGSEEYVFNIYNIGYTGTTFSTGVSGTFKRVINPNNLLETKSKYYVREHKVLTNLNDIVITKDGFEKNVFTEQRKFEYSSITPNNISRVSQKTSSNAFNITLNYDLNLYGLLDNQKRPVSELFLTVINKGYTGYFNKPNNGVGLKQGWEFNITQTSNNCWNDDNTQSNTNIPVQSYVKTNGVTKTFYYNTDLFSGTTMDGDFCEWNNYEQIERVISPYYHKLKYNQDVFQTSILGDTNAPGYYYTPHNKVSIRVFSDYVETGDVGNVDQVPSWSFYSETDQQFRWRDLYDYGFIDNLGRGVDFPFLNSSHYPFNNVIFKLIPDGIDYNSNLLGSPTATVKPIIDGCE